MSLQDFDDYLLYQLAMASHVISSEFHKKLSEKGISPAAWRILYCLWSKPGMRLTELAHHVLYKQPRVTKRVARLQQAGLIKKTIRTEDRRNVYLQLTKKGCDLVHPLIVRSQAHEVKILSSLPEIERLQFRKSLLRLINNVENT